MPICQLCGNVFIKTSVFDSSRENAEIRDFIRRDFFR